MVAGASFQGAVPERVSSTPGTVLCSKGWLCSTSLWGYFCGPLGAMPHAGRSPGGRTVPLWLSG